MLDSIKGLFADGPLGDKNTRQMIGLQMLANSGPTVGAPGNLFAGMPQAVIAGKQLSEKQDDKIKEEERRRMIAKALVGIDNVDPGLAGIDPEFALKVAQLKSKGANGGTEYFAPVYGIDTTTGKPGLGLPGKDGSFKLVDTGGFEVGSPIQEIDTGTEIIMRDRRTGQELGRVKKENFQEAYDKKAGTETAAGDAETASELSRIQSKMPGLMSVVSDLDRLSEEATYTYAGQARDFIARQAGKTTDGARARAEYIAIVDNQILPLLRDTFGAAFTKPEGDSLRATLGDPDASPAEKQAKLKAFIAQKQRDIQALQVRAGEAPAAPAVGNRRRYNPATGQIE